MAPSPMPMQQACERRADEREDGQTPLLPAGHSASDLGPMVQRPENEARRTDGLTARVQQTGRFLQTPVETSCARAVRGRDKIRGCAPCMGAWMLGCLDASRWGDRMGWGRWEDLRSRPWRPELRISANPNYLTVNGFSAQHSTTTADCSPRTPRQTNAWSFTATTIAHVPLPRHACPKNARGPGRAKRI